MVKKLLLDIIDYLKFQVENDKCTMEEMRSIQSAIVNNLDIDCTAMDIAERYNQSHVNVRGLLSRKMISKPKRRVYYNFAKVINILPKTWRVGGNRSDYGNKD